MYYVFFQQYSLTYIYDESCLNLEQRAIILNNFCSGLTQGL